MWFSQFAWIGRLNQYYLGSTAFWIKMSHLVGILVLEVRPMTTLIGWRIAARRRGPVDLARAPMLARISLAQVFLVAAMVVAATAMARGLWQ